MWLPPIEFRLCRFVGHKNQLVERVIVLLEETLVLACPPTSYLLNGLFVSSRELIVIALTCGRQQDIYTTSVCVRVCVIKLKSSSLHKEVESPRNLK